MRVDELMIDHIPPEKHEPVVHDIQWVIRNMYKDIGFTRSEEARQKLRNDALSDIENIIANAETTVLGGQFTKKK